ncbi:MAG: histidine phosphatase family protein [Cytophagales bacterium]|nr:histidine phosphatase family protein [Bernardetiaceae bacterium]MDW8210038.1 histidine phosphatase family protein [Cytophagales bacterium]
MKTLFILRHAQAEDPYLHDNDFDRDLTHQGASKAVRVGKQLAAEGLFPELIIASPAVRTRRTAELLAEQLALSASVSLYDGLYNSSLRLLVEFIAQLSPQYSKVMLVGHNPGVSYLAQWLTGNYDIGVMSTCSLAHVVLNIEHWNQVQQKCGTLVSYRSFE